MRVHSIEKIKILKRLRKKGYSIEELVETLSIPKTTVWHHIHDIKILPKYADALRARQGGSAKRAQKNWENARERAQDLLTGSKRDLCIAIAMLYWGEGSKKSCEFINSDGRMIKSYLIILKKVFNIFDEDIKPTMRIFSGMDKRKCLEYWSGITGIPKHRFIVRVNDGGKRGRTRYGMCRITVKRGGDSLKLMHCLIDQASEDILSNQTVV